MRYISDFAADVAHEFKSPLTSIKGAAELLVVGADDDPEARSRFLRNFQLDAERLDRLVSSLLTLSRIEASAEAKRTEDLEAILARTVERCRERSTGPIDLRYEASHRYFHGRAADVERALGNLIDNAIRHSPVGSPIDVQAVDAKEDMIVVRIHDRGPGVPDAIAPRIFERFFTTDEGRSGTGLGLAIARAVAVAHGGSLELVRVVGDRGACFELRIPHAHA
jgi:two-component system sensor histidine kinase ChvG